MHPNLTSGPQWPQPRLRTQPKMLSHVRLHHLAPLAISIFSLLLLPFAFPYAFFVSVSFALTLCCPFLCFWLSDRHSAQHSERPKSCFNLPSYTVTSSTYSSSTSNYPPPSGSSNANLQFPKTATFASSSQTTTQKAIQPQANTLPQSSFPAAPSGPSAPRQWSSSTSSFGKSSNAVSDARSAPRRGRGLLQSQLSGGVIPFCGYCSQAIR